jgi:hypothetical protein
MASKILMYLSYGPGPHVSEVVFSAMSALHTKRADDTFEIVILTDDAAPYADLPVTIELITPQQMTDWAGPGGFGHRRKIVAFATVLKRFGVPVVLVDGDTYFRKSPQLLFDRIGPGRSVMHVREGELGYLAAHGYMKERLSGLVVDTPTAGKFELPAETVVFNAGVIGMDPSDAKLVDTVLELTDAIHAASPSWLSEQVAFSMILRTRTRLSAVRDIVFHFHEKVMRAPLRAALPGLLKQAAAIPAPQRYAFVYARRPKPPVVKKIKALLKRPLKRLGLFRHDLQTSI